MSNFYKNKKVLITGGLGFIGSNLAIELVEKGADVLLVDSMIPSYGGNLFNIEPVKKKVRLNFSDIRDIHSLNYLVQGKDIIFNLAGTLSHIDSMTDPMTDLEINCRAQLSLLEAIRKYNPSAKIIYAGTRNQYGKAKYLPVDEDHPQEPTDINGVNCVAAEKYHLMYFRVYGVKTVSLRMTNTFGPRHQMKHSRQGVLNWFIRQIMDGEKVILFGGGKQKRDTNYIDDAVEALLIVGAAKKGWGQAYNLGGTAGSLLDFVKKTIEVVKKLQNEVQPRMRLRTGYVVRQFPYERKQIEVGDYIASWKKINKTYGWKPKISLEVGIKKTVEYYKKYKRYYW